MNITQEMLCNLFEYKDGSLYSKKTGKRVGCRHHTGYVHLVVNKKQYNAHRLIFLMHHGYLPETVDHVDGDRSNDRIENLRPATWAQNLQNMKMRASNTSGHKNVRWCKFRNKWTVEISVNKRRFNIGRFDDLEFANLVASEAREKFHGAFARHF
jgi:hypothetical protein